MSVATIRPPAAVYREEQLFAWWIYAVLAGLVSLGWGVLAWRGGMHPGGPPIALIVGLTMPPALVLGLLRMTTEVTPIDCRVWYGFVPTYRRSVPIDLVTRVEVIAYRPVRDHGFWGVRTTRDGERVMTAKGSRAVRLHLADGSRLLIGSQKPEELAACLDRAIRPVV